MIIKFFEINKTHIENKNFILFYGKNEALKNEAIKKIANNKIKPINYEEQEIVDNSDIFINSILNKSLFEEKKIIIIKRATDKIIKILDQIKIERVDDTIIICSENLDKRSKLRTVFEKEKNYICVAFYPDNEQTLLKFAYNFLNKRKISISPSNINILVNKCNGNRESLMNELEKIEIFSKGGNKITLEVVSKLSNLIENESISSLIDNCLAKNKKKISNILNENSFNSEDNIIIIRTFLNKSKKLLELTRQFEVNNNVDLTISSAKPPIFWKDKQITKDQVLKWKSRNIKKLIYQLTEIELQLKKNLINPIHLTTDFILEQSKIDASN